MKNGVYSILKARFLINEEANAAKNWRFIVFLILLAIIMIANNNNVDQKVFKISPLSYKPRSWGLFASKHLIYAPRPTFALV
jgi:TRAP-type mannitol/chloroaromatic compound transport system permease small subunit